MDNKNIIIDKSANWCAAPWHELNVGYDGRVACCCYYAGKTDIWDTVTPFELDTFWNGKRMQEVRKGVIENDLSNQGCKTCSYFTFKNNRSYLDFLSMPSDLNELQRENWKQAINDYSSGKVSISSFPIRYYINFGVMCNINCIMCSQTHIRLKQKSHQLNADAMIRLKPSMRSAYRIGVIGGEPLLMPESIKFIKSISNDPSFNDVWLDIFTNGTLLHKQMKILENHPKINICVSLDSIGKKYEYIRAGAKWKDVEKNIINFQQMSRDKNRNWNVSTANIIMKSNLENLPEHISWHIQNGIVPNFYDFICVEGCETVFEQENIFRFPHLLNEVPEWREIFDTSIAQLDAAGWSGSGDLLRNMKLQLEAGSPIIGLNRVSYKVKRLFQRLKR
jgi:MoaA/NifB/PqqE/SkfB family radical SAM enzyme